jgi:hypothetical protein
MNAPLAARLVTAAFLFAPTGCGRGVGPGWSSSVAASGAPARKELPVSPEIQRFHDFVDRLDLADERYRLEPRHGDGSSCYLELQIPDQAGQFRTWGAIVAEHSGTVIQAEVFQFTLGTLLGVGQLEGPGRLVWLEGKARDRFVRTVAAATYSKDEELRSRHQREFLDYAANHRELEAVVKMWGPMPYDAGFLIKDGTLDEAQPLARFLRADQPQPTNAAVTLPGIPGESTERALARELSDIFVIDALTNQRDRFSGGNLQAISVPDGSKARVQFISYDNGDALDRDETRWIALYLKMVTRFDRRLAEKLFDLDEFLQHRATPYQGFTDERQLQRALGLHGHPQYWALFRRNLGMVVAHIRSVQGQKYFSE